MEAYAGGRQKTHQDNFDDLDLDEPVKRPKTDIRSRLGGEDEDGPELDDSDLRHRLITPIGQQKKGVGIKINLHTNSKKLTEAKPSPPNPFQHAPPNFPPPGFLPPGFTPIGTPFGPPPTTFSPQMMTPLPVAPPSAVDEAEEQQKKIQKRDAAVEKARLQQEMQKLMATEIFHGAAPGRYLYRGLLFKKAPGNNKHRYTCHVCQINVLDNDIVNHAKGKKHATNMEGVKIIDYKKEQDDSIDDKKEKKEIEVRLPPITPGQPVPPGFEENLRRVPLCQSMLDAFGDSPLIGLEYLVELMASEDANCHVICFLCDKRGESFMQNVRQNIISHMIGTAHRMNYLKKHFTVAYEALMKVQNDKFLKTELSRFVRTVVGNIEKVFGRMHPMLVEENTFRSRIQEYRDTIDKLPHFCEAPGKTFDEDIQIPKRPPSVESIELSPERSPSRRNRSPGRRGRSPGRRMIRSRSPGDIWKPDVDRRRSNERKRSPFRRKGQSYRTWRNQSQSPEAGASRVSPFNNRSNVDNGRPIVVRDDTPTLDEESGQEVVEIIPTNKDNGKKMPLSDALRDTTPVSNSDSPLSLSPVPESRRSPPRRRRTSYRDSPPRIDLFGREIERRREYKHSRSPENKRGHHSRRVSRSPRRRRKSLSCSPISSKSNSRSPRPLSRTSDTWSHSSRPIGPREKLDRFRKESDEIERDIKKKRRYYHTQPEKHPAYNEEWKIFWNKKQLDVKNSGRDPTKYDYTPEWKVYWNQRVEELYIHEFQERKRELKRKFHFAEEEEPRKENKGSRGRGSSRGDTASKGGSLTDVKDTWKALTGGDIKEDPKAPEVPEYHTMLGVLRALSVLEPQLGSLGVTINKLMGTAIIMEKAKKGSSEELLLEIENTVLLETIKEKFRGQLMAGIVERFNVYATRNAISNITYILDRAPPPNIKVKIQKAEEAPKTAAVNSILSSNILEPKTGVAAKEAKKEAVAVPGVGNIDRAAIAMQIANALLAQGKTDVSNEELAQLVEAVVGMAQKQSEEASEQEKKIEEEKMAKMEELVMTQNEVNPAEMSEDDLISCLKIFEFLPEHEKHSIIMQLQRLEETDPEKVKELRKYVNAGTEIEKSPKPFFGKIDSEEEDYLDSDVLLAAQKNVEQQTKPKAADSKTVAEATDSMMANLKIPARKMEPISTALPLPQIGASLETTKLPSPSSNRTPLPAASSASAAPLMMSMTPASAPYGVDPMQQQMQQPPFNPYEQQHNPYAQHYQYPQQYGSQPYNYYQPPRSNWPPVNQVRPGSDSNLIPVPMQNFVPGPAVTPVVKQVVHKKRPTGGKNSTLIHLVGKK